MSTKPRLLILTDQFKQDDLRDIPHEGIEVVVRPEISREEFLRIIGDFDAYMCSLRIRIDAEVIAAAPRLRLVATNSTVTVSYTHLTLPTNREV